MTGGKEPHIRTQKTILADRETVGRSCSQCTNDTAREKLPVIQVQDFVAAVYHELRGADFSPPFPLAVDSRLLLIALAAAIA